MVKALYGFIPARAADGGGISRSPLDGQGAGREGLLPALMAFFVDIELTGAHDAFYTKFSHRYV